MGPTKVTHNIVEFFHRQHIELFPLFLNSPGIKLYLFSRWKFIGMLQILVLDLGRFFNCCSINITFLICLIDWFFKFTAIDTIFQLIILMGPERETRSSGLKGESLLFPPIEMGKAISYFQPPSPCTREK